jgi:plasmid stabilization system protein ParE
MIVRFARRAEREVERIDHWWRTNRPDTAQLFASELGAVVTLLTTAPDIGRPYAGKPSVRRILLRRTRYHVYYTRDNDAGAITIVSVWSAVRGQGPRIR